MVERISKYWVIPGLILWVASPALPCTCITQANSNARTAMTDASVVFRGTDCLGDGGYEVGKNYLVYASEQDVQDVTLDGLPAGPFWYGWTDVLPKGTKMLAPQTACVPGGKTSAVRTSLRELGKGRPPAKE
jgi:hypothetical protein